MSIFRYIRNSSFRSVSYTVIRNVLSIEENLSVTYLCQPGNRIRNVNLTIIGDTRNRKDFPTVYDEEGRPVHEWIAADMPNLATERN